MGYANVVSGTGRGTYYFYDPSGQKRLGARSTGQLVELLPGSYQVELTTEFQCRLKQKKKLPYRSVSGTVRIFLQSIF